MTEFELSAAWEAVASSASRVTCQAHSPVALAVGTTIPEATSPFFVLEGDTNSYVNESFTGLTLYARAYTQPLSRLVVHTVA